MKQYLELMDKILREGAEKSDRTGTGTLSLFGEQLRFDLAKGFPLLTTKKMFFKGIVYELLWFLRGDTNIKYLNEHGVHIWDAWSDEDGNVNKIYGKTWLDFGGVNQIAEAINLLQTNPDSRRIIVSAWNPPDIPNMVMTPCHVLFQLYVVNNKLSCHMYQRSADYFLGVPFNIASYALLTQMIAEICEFDLGDLIISFGDVHLYLNHLDQAREQVLRLPYALSEVLLTADSKNIFNFSFDDFCLVNYYHQEAIKADISV